MRLAECFAWRSIRTRKRGARQQGPKPLKKPGGAGNLQSSHDESQYPLVDDFLYSHHLSGWQCIDNVRRYCILITPGSEKVDHFYLPSFPQAIMFWVIDNFLMRKKKKLFQTDDPRRNKVNKVKYEKRNVVNGSDEEAVLLDNMAAEGESLTIPDEIVHHRDTVRR